MKAVIVDINGKNAVALCKNGEFIKLKNKYNFNVGNEIDVSAEKVINLKAFTKVASIAAMFLLLVGLSFGMYTYSKPYSYIDIDINPSIEITTNVFNRVIFIRGLNKDGEKILETGKYKNKNIEACIKIVLDSAVKNGYLLTEKNNAVLFTVSSYDEEKTAQIEKVVNSSAQKELKEVNVVIKILTEKASIKSHDEALKLGISPGKLQLIEKLQKNNPEVKVEDYKDASVKRIIKEIQEGSKAEDSNKDESDKSDTQSSTDKNRVIEKEDQKDKKEEEKIENEIKKQGKSTTSKKQSNSKKSEDNDTIIKNQDKDKEISDINKKKEDDQRDSKDQKEKEEQRNSNLKNKTEKQKDGNSREETKDKPKDKGRNKVKDKR